MSYLKKSPTLVIFFLLVLIIGIFAFSAVFYQKSLSGLNDKISDKDETIEKLNADISSLNLNLSNIKSLLDLQMMREENLTGLYTGLKNERDTLESEKKSLQKRINDTETELFKAKFEINLLVEEISSMKLNYTELNNSYEEVLDDIEDVCTKASFLNISECGEYD